MAETTNVSLQPTLQSFFLALDPIALILTQRNSYSHHPLPLRLTTQNRIMERGPRYEAYAELRESKLRIKFITQQQPDEPESDPKLATPPTKQVRFQASSERERHNLCGSHLNRGRRGCSVLAQSVPDFSAAALRKENRKPANTTPPSKSFSKVVSNSRGSKSASAGEKRGGGVLMARKSYAAIDLRSLSSALGNAINGESRGGRTTVLG